MGIIVTLRIVLLLSLSLVAATSANAEFGTIDEVIQAAEDNREPDYIQDLMGALSKKLRVLAQKKGIKPPRQMLAWLLTMRAILDSVNQTAMNGAWHVCRTEAEKNAWSTAMDAVKEATSEQGWSEALDGALATAKKVLSDTAAWAAANAASLNAAQNDRPKNRGRIAHRAAEWGALNSFFKDIDALFEKTFDVTLNALPTNPQNNPFDSPASWREFHENYFGSLSKDTMVFLVPWLNPSVFVAEHHTLTTLLTLYSYVDRAFIDFPKELLAYIIAASVYFPLHS